MTGYKFFEGNDKLEADKFAKGRYGTTFRLKDIDSNKYVLPDKYSLERIIDYYGKSFIGELEEEEFSHLMYLCVGIAFSACHESFVATNIFYNHINNILAGVSKLMEIEVSGNNKFDIFEASMFMSFSERISNIDRIKIINYINNLCDTKEFKEAFIRTLKQNTKLGLTKKDISFDKCRIFELVEEL